MTLIATPISVSAPDDSAAALESARAAIERGASMIEWRVDALVPTAGAAAEGVLRDLVSRSPAPCIVTCRTAEEGGLASPDDLLRVAEMIAAAGVAPRYLDVELAAFRRSAELREACAAVTGGTAAAETGLILSAHDLAGRPADLLQRVEAMTVEPACAVIKVAWTARSIRDNLEAFDLLGERRKPTIALCMGDAGLMSRVLAAKFGGLITFAAAAEGAGSAPGQPTIETLRDLYRFDSVGAGTRVYGLVGWPVAHSRGPAVHNAGFAAVGHDGVYLPLPVPPEYEHFKASVGSLVDHPRLSFAGASVTVPHKEHLIRFVRERGGAIEAAAERCGAANTLIVGDDGSLECRNTDGAAAVAALLEHAEPGRRDLAGEPAAVLGAGGVARAVVAELTALGANVVVFNRTPERAHALAAAFGATPGDATRDRRFRFVVNCTSVGMEGGPDPAGIPGPTDLVLDETVTVMDTVYAPERTPLLRAAASRGAPTITGARMFLRQAAAQFEAWTDGPAPAGVFRPGSGGERRDGA